MHESEILKKIRGASSEEVPSIIVSYIKAAVYKVLGSDESTQVSMEEPLMEQGFDSLMSVEFSNLVSKDLDISLPVGFLFSYPTIRAISNYLKNEFFGKDNSVKSDEKVAASLKDPNNLDYIDALSDGELEELIRKDLL
ncbi:MAG: acyl carrier protein [Nitrospirae bacterium]|nr:acyl carrier protein [Nitrospirota bacterium]